MIKVREGHASDWKFIVEAQIAMAWETEEMRLDRPTVEKGVQAVIDDANKGQYWIAESGEKPVGMCLTLPEWSDWRNGTVLWIHSVYTIKEHRGTGVYAALYKHLKEMVEGHRELRGLRLYVDKRNVNAQKVYERLGMSADHYALYEWMKN